MKCNPARSFTVFSKKSPISTLTAIQHPAKALHMIRPIPVSILDNLAGRVLRGIVMLAAAFPALFAASFADADSKAINYSGHYEVAAIKSDRSFSLDVKQKPRDDDATISFSAAMTDGSGAAPDATGKGEVDDGVLSFKFKDSYDNEGTGTLVLKNHAYHLTLTVTKVVDFAPLHFYGGMLLKQTK